MRTFLYVILVLLLLVACKEVFDVPPQSLMETKLTFSNPEEDNSLPISVKGLEKDSFIIYQEKTDMFRLPLTRDDSTSFVIFFNTIPDTFSIKHDTEVAYESFESGFFTKHKIKEIEYTRNRIDSVAVIDSLVNQFWHENIQIYINTLPIPAN